MGILGLLFLVAWRTKKRPTQADSVVDQKADAADAASPDEYRANLQRLAEGSQSDYDKAVMTLSGGALGISFGYLKDIAGPPPHHHSFWLVASWLCWTLSVTACLYSLASSASALRKAIEQHDSGKIETERPGGILDLVTICLNAAGGILFVFGTIFMIAFATANQNEQSQTTASPTPIATSPPAAASPGPSPSAAGARPASTSTPTSSASSPPVTP